MTGPRRQALPRFALVVLQLLLVAPARLPAQATPGAGAPPLKGYSTRLRLDAPIHAGKGRTITGSGAPAGSGIWVELWRIPARGGRAESVGSVAAANGRFTFSGVDVEAGEALYVTLSRSWHFRTPGDLEGWDAFTSDVLLRAEHGFLEIELRNLDSDAVLDPQIQAFFPFNPRYYRVVEIRLLNPVPVPSFVSLFWGSPWGTRIGEHVADIPHAMESFETILFPMNADERRITPPPFQEGLDGLWDRGALNDSLRIDPVESDISPASPSLEGFVFLIDTIRIREDYRREFHHTGDVEGLLVTNDTRDFSAGGGFLTYAAGDVGLSSSPRADGAVDPYILSGLAAGKLDTSYFTRFAIGMENEEVAMDPLSLGIFFDDRDSRDYRDNGGAGPLQRGELSLPALGRRDEVRAMNAISGGEWTEDGGRIAASNLRLDCPEGAREGDRIRIDYFGWIPDDPYGPSEAVPVESASPGPAPSVALGLSGPCGEAVEGEALSLYSAPVSCTLTTSENPLGQGASGWSISIGVEGGAITGITTQGTAAASVTASPPGLLRDDGFALVELTAGPGNEGAVSAVVLSSGLPVTLPPAGTALVVRLALEARFPAAGTRAVRVFYAGGRQGSGLPVENAVSFFGNTVAPSLGECAFELRASGAGNIWRTYDCQNDGRMDLSDAVCHLNFLFLGGGAPGCMEAMDFNGDLNRDISDPVAELNFLFLGGPPPPRGAGCQVYSTCGPSAHCP